MKKTFVGIDVSKGWLDLAICQDTEIILEKRINNDSKGIIQVCNQLIRKYGTENLWFCFEHTGNYGLLLSCILEEKGLTYSAVPALEIKRSLGITRGKNDQVDASRIAKYASVNKHKLKASLLPSESLLIIKQLLTYRGQLVKVRTQFKNSLKAHKIAHQVVKSDFIPHQIEEKIAGLDADILVVEKQIKEQIDQQPELEKNHGLITSVKGVGLIVAAYLLVSTSNFTAFDGPRKYNCYTGLAPFESSSGITKGSARTSNLANKTIKTLLFNGANSAAMHDPQLKKYYQRKIAEGKAHNVVINAVACKLVYRVFATIQRQSPYVVLAN